MIKRLHLFAPLIALYILSGCSVSKQIAKKADSILLKDSSISTGHIGICIYEPATNKYWYEYDATHYFIPASNTKLFTLYAGMKYLGDSLVGLRYEYYDDTTITIFPTGDPTFLHKDFTTQPVLNFLFNNNKTFFLYNSNWKENALGFGWAWDDYTSSDMAERSAFPISGNIIRINLLSSDYKLNKNNGRGYNNLNWTITPKYFKSGIPDYFILPLKIAAIIRDSINEKRLLQNFSIKRNWDNNNLSLSYSSSKFVSDVIPFHTNNDSTATEILKTDYSINIQRGARIKHIDFDPDSIFTIHSQPSDSLFKPMMHRSDNFFAEQTLLMASNEHLGYMNDEKIIDTILNTDLKDVPQKPKWVDGCGLSRYNLFTPKSFVYILNKMKNEFGFNRMKVILATGGEGTLSSYYKKDAGFIYAKTGTLSNNCALSGYLVTNKGKLLIFSILANNYITGATPVRRAVERFLEGLREKY